MKTIVLVEPICRGSRLQILANVLSALKGFAQVILITRQDYQSDHFTELIIDTGLLPRIVVAETNLGAAWMKNLSRHELQAFIEKVELINFELSNIVPYDLVFMALDDYLVSFSFIALKLRVKLKNVNIYCIKYRVEYLFTLQKRFKVRGLMLRVLTRWSLFVTGSKLICFDERLNNPRPSYVAGVLPDPWFGPFSPNYRSVGRALLNLKDTDFVLLTLGKQDRRKGIDFLLNAFPILAENIQVKLAVVGRISDEFIQYFDVIKLRFSSQIIHINSFVAETDLPKYFASADAFLLPYSIDFTATSGTLSRAAASGVPVLASGHGLVGHRIREFGLGETFEIGDQISFLNAANLLRTYSVKQKRQVFNNGMKFANTCALPVFESTLRKILIR